MSSIRKESFSSESTVAVTPTLIGGNALPVVKDTSTRFSYLSARVINVSLAVALVVMAIIAGTASHRSRWMSAVLSPAITSLCYGTAEIISVQCYQKRAHWRMRLLYDGAIGVGCAVAGGFLVSFTLPDFKHQRDNSHDDTRSLALLLLICMFSQMVVHWGISTKAAIERLNAFSPQSTEREQTC